jgi:hypothetical protein
MIHDAGSGPGVVSPTISRPESRITVTQKKTELQVFTSSARKIQATRLTARSGPVAFRPRLTTGLAFQVFDIFL